MIKIYTKEIPGKDLGKEKIKLFSEDSHYADVLSDSSGKEWGLAVIADGLSGFDGNFASHIAVKAVRDHLESRLKEKTVAPPETLLKEAVLAANEAIETKYINAFTTLDLVLCSADQSWGAHLGDGRIYRQSQDNSFELLTIDEGHPHHGPTNYIGKNRIPRNLAPLEERISLIDLGQKPIRTLLLATDGLYSRVSEKKTKEICSNSSRYYDPSRTLELLAEAVKNPEEEMQENRFDDTTLILLVMDDPIGPALEELRRLESEEKPYLENELRSAKTEIRSLLEAARREEETSQQHSAEYTQSRTELTAERDGYKQKLETKEEENRSQAGKITELTNTITEMKENYKQVTEAINAPEPKECAGITASPEETIRTQNYKQLKAWIQKNVVDPTKRTVEGWFKK